MKEELQTQYHKIRAAALLMGVGTYEYKHILMGVYGNKISIEDIKNKVAIKISSPKRAYKEGIDFIQECMENITNVNVE